MERRKFRVSEESVWEAVETCGSKESSNVVEMNIKKVLEIFILSFLWTFDLGLENIFLLKTIFLII